MPKLQHVKKSTPLSPYAVYKYGDEMIVQIKGKKPFAVKPGKKKKPK